MAPPSDGHTSLIVTPFSTDFRTPEKKIPAAVKQARQKLSELGISKIDSESMAKLPPAIRQKLTTAFRTQAEAAVKDEYAKLDSDTARREWMAAFVLDPQGAVSHGINKSICIDETLKHSDGAWMHVWEIGGPEGINCQAAAVTLCASGDLGEGRESEYSSLAAGGHRQYWFSKNFTRSSVGKREERGTESRAELNAGEAQEVRDAISSNAPTRAHKRKAPQQPESPTKAAEKKRRKELTSQRRTTSSKLKSLIDRVTNEHSDLSNKLPVLQQRGYPDMMTAWCETKVDSIKSGISSASTTYATSVTQTVTPSTPLEQLAGEITTLDECTAALAKDHIEWKRGPVAEVTKLVG